MFRRLLIAFVLLLVIGVVAIDRVGAHVAGHVLAGKLQSDEHLDRRPTVSIDGIPFLTQAFGGKYDEVDVTAHDYTTKDGVPVATLKAQLHGVHIPFSSVLDGKVSRVPVDRVDGSVTLSFAGIEHYLEGRGVPVTLSRASVRAIEVIAHAARGKLVQALTTVAVSGADVVLKLGAAFSAVPQADLAIPLRSLPFRFKVTSVQVSASGIIGTGTADHVVLGT